MINFHLLKACSTSRIGNYNVFQIGVNDQEHLCKMRGFLLSEVDQEFLFDGRALNMDQT